MIDRIRLLEQVLAKWKDRLLTFWGNEIVFGGVEIEQQSKSFLQTKGLPIIGFEYAIGFIPVTLLSLSNINGENYCVLGDFSVKAPGISFIGLKEKSNVLYYLSRKKSGGWNEVEYLNSSLDNFVIFLYFYCSFMKKYENIGYPNIGGKEIIEDYEKLELTLTKLDSEAMIYDLFWGNMVFSIKTIYGDFLP